MLSVVIQEVRLQPARIADARGIARLSRSLIEQGLPWRWTPQRVASEIRDPETEVVVATDEGELVGFCMMKFDFRGRRAHLLLLAVAATHRRRGLGAAFVDWLEKMARLGGIATIELEVRAINRSGRDFYAALGYEEVGHLPGYYQRREDAVRMVSRLDPRSKR